MNFTVWFDLIWYQHPPLDSNKSVNAGGLFFRKRAKKNTWIMSTESGITLDSTGNFFKNSYRNYLKRSSSIIAPSTKQTCFAVLLSQRATFSKNNDLWTPVFPVAHGSWLMVFFVAKFKVQCVHWFNVVCTTVATLATFQQGEIMMKSVQMLAQNWGVSN